MEVIVVLVVCSVLVAVGFLIAFGKNLARRSIAHKRPISRWSRIAS